MTTHRIVALKLNAIHTRRLPSEPVVGHIPTHNTLTAHRAVQSETALRPSFETEQVTVLWDVASKGRMCDDELPAGAMTVEVRLVEVGIGTDPVPVGKPTSQFCDFICVSSALLRGARL